jgi:DNA-binding IclR family transcriptional regulator
MISDFQRRVAAEFRNEARRLEDEARQLKEYAWAVDRQGRKPGTRNGATPRRKRTRKPKANGSS